MSNYYQVAIPVTDTGIRELLIAQLAEIGYEGFEETDDQLQAFIPEHQFSDTALSDLLSEYGITYSKSIILKQNWNTLWESNFDPVQVDDFVGVRAGFHLPFDHVQHEIIITPKMSFGTGHHATTYMVMQLMRALDFHGKVVFDFGTGTGILAILAEKLGATAVLAADNDDWCIENATENISINSCNCIEIQKVNNARQNKKFDIIIANINKNIILGNIPFLADALLPDGHILLSGLLREDEQDILNACRQAAGWEHLQTITRTGWIACHFKG
jgi:ribosomal protein L11 methyltransferase